LTIAGAKVFGLFSFLMIKGKYPAVFVDNKPLRHLLIKLRKSVRDLKTGFHVKKNYSVFS
jgi:hypothetical protein